MKTPIVATLAILMLIASIASAETPDECATRLDQSIAITTYDEAAAWWAQVEQECGIEASITSTPESSFIDLFPASGELAFCVISATLNIRREPGGAIVDSFAKGEIFTVNLATKIKHQGYVWAQHKKGWSALYPLPGEGKDPDSLTHPSSCPSPTPTPKPRTTPARAQRSTAQHEVIQTGQTKTFQLSGADCAITASRTLSIVQDKLSFAVGRLGWLKDEFIVDLFAPSARSALSFVEQDVHGEQVGTYTHQLYLPGSTKEVLGFYTIEVATYTASKKFSLRVNSVATYNLAVACD